DLDVVRVEEGAEFGGLAQGIDPLASRFDLLDAGSGAAGEELVGQKRSRLRRVARDGAETDHRPEEQRESGEPHPPLLAPEGGRDVAQEEPLPLDGAGSAPAPVDESIRAADELVDGPEELRIGGERARLVEVGARAPVEEEQLVQARASE